MTEQGLVHELVQRSRLAAQHPPVHRRRELHLTHVRRADQLPEAAGHQIEDVPKPGAVALLLELGSDRSRCREMSCTHAGRDDIDEPACAWRPQQAITPPRRTEDSRPSRGPAGSSGTSPVVAWQSSATALNVLV
jgi:hypothetical protein